MQLWWKGQIGEKAENYRAGGALGEVERKTSTDGERMVANTSRRFTSGTTARSKVWVVTAEPAVEQS
jgi:hypothetical protein